MTMLNGRTISSLDKEDEEILNELWCYGSNPFQKALIVLSREIRRSTNIRHEIACADLVIYRLEREIRYTELKIISYLVYKNRYGIQNVHISQSLLEYLMRNLIKDPIIL